MYTSIAETLHILNTSLDIELPRIPVRFIAERGTKRVLAKSKSTPKTTPSCRAPPLLQRPSVRMHTIPTRTLSRPAPPHRPIASISPVNPSPPALPSYGWTWRCPQTLPKLAQSFAEWRRSLCRPPQFSFNRRGDHDAVICFLGSRPCGNGAKGKLG